MIILIRYIHSIKALAEQSESMGVSSGGIVQLPESGIGNEEVHALVALLKVKIFYLYIFKNLHSLTHFA